MLVGAEAKLGAVSEEARPQEFGVGQTSSGSTKRDVGAADLTSMIYSGVERRMDAIINYRDI